jgi:transposase
MPVMIGVDPHKSSHTAAALDEQGQLLNRQQIPATLEGYQALGAWAARWPERCWAVEGAHGIGRALAQRLVGDGEQVLDVPAKLAARVRVLSVGHGRRSDPQARRRGRFPTKHHFAAHTGTAPIEASSGQVVLHRLSRAGDRKLNHALYMMAMVQVRRPSAGQAYYQRKLAEGKSPRKPCAP